MGRLADAQPQLHQPSRADAFPDPRSGDKFTAAFDKLIRRESRSSTRALASNTGERLSGAVRPHLRNECLDRLLIIGRRHPEQVLCTYVQHYNRERPHRSIALQPPEPVPVEQPPSGDIRRRDQLGGLVHEYYRAAA